MMVVWNKEKCLRCGGCVGVCPKAALGLKESGLLVDVQKCVNCGICASFCPVRALKLE
ncbi:MAG: 4Fe-4S binding protein [Candidatus Aenigmarchaeota archaeon]|nr:4Fe-4S binding protein [Candidatus Aenigmarchaeota archaeon]